MLARLSLAAGKRRFRDLSEQEVLALAISSEEEDGQAAYAAKLRAQYPASAAVFDGMAAEENEHRRRLIELYQQRFGDFIVPLRREHVADFYTRRPFWLIENFGLPQTSNLCARSKRRCVIGISLSGRTQVRGIHAQEYYAMAKPEIAKPTDTAVSRPRDIFSAMRGEMDRM